MEYKTFIEKSFGIILSKESTIQYYSEKEDEEFMLEITAKIKMPDAEMENIKKNIKIKGWYNLNDWGESPYFDVGWWDLNRVEKKYLTYSTAYPKYPTIRYFIIIGTDHAGNKAMYFILQNCKTPMH